MNNYGNCVYLMRNTTNNLIYVGQTKNLKKRMWLHENDLKTGRGYNEQLSSDYKDHGFTFEFIVLENVECDKERKLREKFWMDTLQSLNPAIGYNRRSDGVDGMIAHRLTREKITKNLKEQWASGVRDGHGDKLKESWSKSPDRKRKQSLLMSKIKQKYIYIVDDRNRCDYKELVDMNLHNVVAKFHKYKTDDVEFKGHSIKRVAL